MSSAPPPMRAALCSMVQKDIAQRVAEERPGASRRRTTPSGRRCSIGVGPLRVLRSYRSAQHLRCLRGRHAPRLPQGSSTSVVGASPRSGSLAAKSSASGSAATYPFVVGVLGQESPKLVQCVAMGSASSSVAGGGIGYRDPTACGLWHVSASSCRCLGGSCLVGAGATRAPSPSAPPAGWVGLRGHLLLVAGRQGRHPSLPALGGVPRASQGVWCRSRVGSAPCPWLKNAAKRAARGDRQTGRRARARATSLGDEPCRGRRVPPLSGTGGRRRAAREVALRIRRLCRCVGRGRPHARFARSAHGLLKDPRQAGVATLLVSKLFVRHTSPGGRGGRLA